jgi:hypothetical protein
MRSMSPRMSAAAILTPSCSNAAAAISSAICWRRAGGPRGSSFEEARLFGFGYVTRPIESHTKPQNDLRPRTADRLGRRIAK